MNVPLKACCHKYINKDDSFGSNTEKGDHAVCFLCCFLFCIQMIFLSILCLLYFLDACYMLCRNSREVGLRSQPGISMDVAFSRMEKPTAGETIAMAAWAPEKYPNQENTS